MQGVGAPTTDPFPLRIYRERREALMRRMGKGVALFLGPGPVQDETRMVFRSSADLLYLTGLNEPAVALVLLAARGGPRPQSHLFLRPYDARDEQFNGRQVCAEQGSARFGVDGVHPMADLRNRLAEWLKSCGTFWVAEPGAPELDQMVQEVRRDLSRVGVRRPAECDLTPLVHGLRQRKSPGELERIRGAVRMVEGAYRAAAAIIKPGVTEGELAARISYEIRRAGGEEAAYGPVVGSGPGAAFLQYRRGGRARLRAGDLVLVDTVAFDRGYACDVTRVFPVSGRFTEAQTRVYELVHQAQAAALRRCRPGVPFIELYRAAVTVLTRGLMALGVLKRQRVRDAVEKKLYLPFFPHGIGHGVGLDPHDAGLFPTASGTSPILQPGMVLTVEPGLYFLPHRRGVPRPYRGIGVRLEDTVRVTRGGCEVLSRGLPSLRREVEKWVQLRAGLFA